MSADLPYLTSDSRLRGSWKAARECSARNDLSHRHRLVLPSCLHRQRPPIPFPVLSHSRSPPFSVRTLLPPLCPCQPAPTMATTYSTTTATHPRPCSRPALRAGRVRFSRPPQHYSPASPSTRTTPRSHVCSLAPQSSSRMLPNKGMLCFFFGLRQMLEVSILKRQPSLRTHLDNITYTLLMSFYVLVPGRRSI